MGGWRWRSVSQRLALWALVAVVLVAAGVVLVRPAWVGGLFDHPPASDAGATTTVGAGGARPAGCEVWPARAVVPQQVGVDGVGFRGVQSLARVVTGGVTSSAGPADDNPGVFAWDNQSPAPGSPAGRVLLTAHTFHADDTALGNLLLAGLQVRDLVRVRTTAGTLCYRVTERRQMPVADYPVADIYQSTTEGLAVTVCSDYHDGQWQQRTAWFADPVT